VEEGCLQAAEGCGGGLQRQGEEQARLREADVAGPGERRHPRGFGVDGGLCCVHSGLRHRQAGAQAERRFLRLRMGPEGVDQGQRMLWVSRVRRGPPSASALLYCWVWEGMGAELAHCVVKRTWKSTPSNNELTIIESACVRGNDRKGEEPP